MQLTALRATADIDSDFIEALVENDEEVEVTEEINHNGVAFALIVKEDGSQGFVKISMLNPVKRRH